MLEYQEVIICTDLCSNNKNKEFVNPGVNTLEGNVVELILFLSPFIKPKIIINKSKGILIQLRTIPTFCTFS